MNTPDLSPLPEPFVPLYGDERRKWADQMRAYAAAAVLAEREKLMPYFFIGQDLSRHLNEGATITAERLPCLQPQADGSVLGNLKITYLTAIRAEPESKEQQP